MRAATRERMISIMARGRPGGWPTFAAFAGCPRFAPVLWVLTWVAACSGGTPTPKSQNGKHLPFPPSNR
jgi:hypothetical protein